VGQFGLVVTVAGTGSAGFENGLDSLAQFNLPFHVAVASDAVVYITDSANHALRRLTPEGDVTTLVGFGGFPGFRDGEGPGAMFNFPRGIACDEGDTLFVADHSNHAIRKVCTDGYVVTIAGNGSSGFVDGPDTTARFDGPSGIAVGPDGYLYVADKGNHAIRGVSPGGIVTTIAGDGQPGFIDGVGANARFAQPRGIAVRADGYLYVADSNNHCIRLVSPGGVVTTIAGDGSPGFEDGEGSVARFDTPVGLAVDADGALYVCDTNNHSLRRLTAPASSVPASVADGFLVAQNAPNPFRTQTRLAYRLPHAARVHLSIFDVRGRLVRVIAAGDLQVAGAHGAVWNGRDEAGVRVAAGVYLYRLEAGDFRSTRRMVLTR